MTFYVQNHTSESGTYGWFSSFVVSCRPQCLWLSVPQAKCSFSTLRRKHHATYIYMYENTIYPNNLWLFYDSPRDLVAHFQTFRHLDWNPDHLQRWIQICPLNIRPAFARKNKGCELVKKKDSHDNSLNVGARSLYISKHNYYSIKLLNYLKRWVLHRCRRAPFVYWPLILRP